MANRKPVGNASLFKKDAHARFMETTGARYNSMKARVKAKLHLELPFSLEEFRADVLKVMGGFEDGVLTCRYCTGIFPVEEIAADHALPISRGGGPELSNIDYPCITCNQAKESLTPDEFIKLLRFLDTEIPLAKTNILARLQKAISLAIGMWRNTAIIDYLKTTGDWQRASKILADRKRDKDLGLKPF